MFLSKLKQGARLKPWLGLGHSPSTALETTCICSGVWQAAWHSVQQTNSCLWVLLSQSLDDVSSSIPPVPDLFDDMQLEVVHLTRTLI